MFSVAFLKLTLQKWRTNVNKDSSFTKVYYFILTTLDMG